MTAIRGPSTLDCGETRAASWGHWCPSHRSRPILLTGYCTALLCRSPLAARHFTWFRIVQSHRGTDMTRESTGPGTGPPDALAMDRAVPLLTSAHSGDSNGDGGVARTLDSVETFVGEVNEIMTSGLYLDADLRPRDIAALESGLQAVPAAALGIDTLLTDGSPRLRGLNKTPDPAGPLTCWPRRFGRLRNPGVPTPCTRLVRVDVDDQISWSAGPSGQNPCRSLGRFDGNKSAGFQ